MKSRLTTTAAASALMVLALSASAADGWSVPSWLRGRTATTPAATPATAPARPEALAPGQLPNYRAIVQTQGPAVVGITVAGLRGGPDGVGPDRPDSAAGSEGDDPYFRFFRGLPGLRPPPGPLPFRGQASGFIVSADGLVLTSAHVVRDARQVTVKLSDRREFTARVLGIDTATDIAVLKVDAKGLPTVTLGDAKSVQVGDWVLAIGAPYGFEQSATQGIVSAKGRSLPGENVVPFIQTDAAVNPGNSGGPLFDAGGRVVGVNAQIYSQSGGFQGLAFAIPLDVALHVKDQIVKHGRVDHARLGVTLQDLSAPLAASFGLEAPDGALVSSVAAGSAAAKAGLKAGDVITAVGDAPVQTAGDVSSRIGLARPGDRLTLVLWRGKARVDVPVVLGRAEPPERQAAAAPESGTLGLAVRPLERSELREAGVDHGLLVEQVSGPAQLAGIQPGDVLLALNGRPVQRVEQVREALRERPRQVALLVMREGQQIFVPVHLG
ncbi:MAG: Do family serine endopeptidase [Burkholderiales bacterium]|nr:Do family serine endopeptidase [Burkholderiales bacterium]